MLADLRVFVAASDEVFRVVVVSFACADAGFCCCDCFVAGFYGCVVGTLEEVAVLSHCSGGEEERDNE